MRSKKRVRNWRGKHTSQGGVKEGVTKTYEECRENESGDSEYIGGMKGEVMSRKGICLVGKWEGK